MTVLTDDKGRSIELRELGPDDTLNLIETAGEAGPSWLKYAMVVATVAAIDGEPAPPLGCPKPIFLAFAKKLGNDGVVAVQRHAFGLDADVVSVAKN